MMNPFSLGFLLPLLHTVLAQNVGNSTSPAQPANSVVANVINYKRPGGNPSALRNGGPWHWGPGQHGGGPGFGHHPRPHGPGNCVHIQTTFPAGTNGQGSVAASRAEAIKQAYVDAWNDYADHAFGADGYAPISKTGEGGSGGWGLIIIDGIDTAVVMGLQDIVERQLEWIAGRDFNVSADPQIDGFDTTIRLIGGLLSAYDLITSGKVPYANEYNKTQVATLLAGAKTLADFLSPIFDSETGIPYFWINATTREPFAGPSSTASVGTIILEYHRLSDLTGDDKYRNQADKAESYLINPHPQTIFPAIVGGNLDQDTGLFTNDAGGWQSGIDSFYEYLIKSVVYNPDQEYANDYRNFWTTAVDSTIKHLAIHPYGHPELTFITTLNNTGAPLYASDDYTCFAGGNYLLGGAYLGRQDYIDLGIAVTDSCHAFYNTTVSGLNPISYSFYGPDNMAADPQYNGDSDTAKAAQAMAAKNGYFLPDDLFKIYTLYPEPIESMFYAWRITGDTTWQDYSWETFQNVQKDANRPPVAISDLGDITQPMGGGQFNDVPR